MKTEEITHKLPAQLIKFFKRKNLNSNIENAYPLVERLYTNLLAGHPSLQIEPDNDEIEVLRINNLVGSPDDMAPFVLSSTNDLYFRRYYEYENLIAQKLKSWTTEQITSYRADYDFLRRILKDDHDQFSAAQLSLENKFSIITGGPGTGKTYLLVTILYSLLKYNPTLQVTLAAPTGKAAQRMTEAILSNLEHLALSDQEKELFPKEASTIHRLLQPLPPSIYFKKTSKNPLHSDFVIIDEASMIDLPLMAKLFEAIPSHCRILLIGDVDQLAPVEAGAPFSSIVRHFLLPDQPKLVAKLTTNRRFSEDSTINLLCRSVSNGDAESVKQIISEDKRKDFAFYDNDYRDAEIDRLINRGYETLSKAKDPAEAHKAFLKFQILCPTHGGENGVIAMNKKCLALFGAKLHSPGAKFSGLPIIIKQNDYGSGLFNGDIGIFLPSTKETANLSVWFSNNDGSYREISPARLPSYEVAFAMTIHRSQGSEYQEVLVMIPDVISEILSRHLLYVACSRARQKVCIYGSSKIFIESVEKNTIISQSLENRMLEMN